MLQAWYEMMRSSSGKQLCILPLPWQFLEQHQVGIKWGGGGGALAQKHLTVISWNHARAREAVQEDYWGSRPRFNDLMFERVFRLLTTFSRESIDCMGKVCICPKVKMLMVLKILAYGVFPTAFQDNFQMGITIALTCLKIFCKITSNNHHQISCSDARRLSNVHFHHHGVPGMVDSLYCMHLCPFTLQGQYEGKEEKNSLYSGGSVWS